MAASFANPTVLGLYINSYKRGTNSDPYTQLLGTDGFGSYSGGNKITQLCSYIAQFQYNYGLFYNLESSSSFVSLICNPIFSPRYSASSVPNLTGMIIF